VLQLVHDWEYVQAYRDGRLEAKAQRRIGLPWSQGLVNRTFRAVGGTILTARLALEYGIACNTAGGTHHAFPNFGSGFCIFNDLAIAARILQKEGLVKKILIVDLDVHQGNGTAVVFQNEPRVFTFSMHGKENYPLKKEISDLDIELPTYCDDEQYLTLLYETLPRLIEQEKPQFIFYISGVDILLSDKLGKLKVSMEGCRRRDEFVFEQAIKHKIPVVVSMGGAYSPRIADIVEAHCNTFRLAEKMYF
jgi:acetoin utilization deacetylase AcuC-like enzyme